MSKIPVIQLIKTWQGEAPGSGRSILLLRFKHCTLSCPWCDTKVLMDNTIESFISIQQCQDVIDKYKLGLLITGGEPTHPLNIKHTVDLINQLEYPYAYVETNGHNLIELIKSVALKKIPLVTFQWSPKIFDDKSFVSVQKRLLELVDNFDIKNKINLIFKIVYSDSDFDKTTKHYIEMFFKEINRLDLNKNCFVMPMGMNFDDIRKNSGCCFDICEKYKLNFSSRDHIVYSFL